VRGGSVYRNRQGEFTRQKVKAFLIPPSRFYNNDDPFRPSTEETQHDLVLSDPTNNGVPDLVADGWLAGKLLKGRKEVTL